MATLAEGPESMGSYRRKACDLCFTKKIKCDMVKPTCSNCKLYHTECRKGFVRRRQRATYRSLTDPYVKSYPRGVSDHSNSLEARLAQIEDQVHRNMRIIKTPSFTPSSTAGPRQYGNSSEIMTASAEPQLREVRRSAGAWALGVVEPSLFGSFELRSLLLPPREEISPVIDHYFLNTNNLIPLFHRQSFMGLLDDWYGSPASRNRIKWAAIQIVMALGLRTIEPQAGDLFPSTIQRSNAHLNNAQSALSELVICDEDLLGIQILLGIVILYQNSSDQRPASVIIASALRLGHRLLLHSSKSQQFFSEEEALQRSRIFWIAYALDKEISIRVKTPSIQSDNDIDLPLPPLTSPDGAGVICTRDGHSRTNVFLLRVQLAHIHGKIYDLLYSNRASAVDRLERRRRIIQLQAKLEYWYESIPLAFRIENLSSTACGEGLVQMTKIYHGFLLAEVMAHGFYSRDADWLKRISAVSTISMNDVTLTQNHFGTARSNTVEEPPSPLGWDKLVQISRGCMKLFHVATQIECLACCGHFSALMVLLANMFLHPSHACLSQDQRLIFRSIDMFESILGAVRDRAFESVYKMVSELVKKASDAVESYNLFEDANTADLVQDFRADWENFLATEGFGYYNFAEEPNLFTSSFDADSFGMPFDQVAQHT
ncbi:hypothetical protein N7510_008122 [Penicillium lagena]|uniref:uncharacterized protein n=1 Tax=Penicillium lagena TaxID=94218 RepID=UPI00253FF768|nr:uncharacterized protein N7510_008122 [Penicillium lagena]KAJ5611403.1 hypothetical protein N7510_008122 [Penicillium lagena]